LKLSIIIPAYNEGKTIAKLLRKVIAADIGKVKKQIIVVDDGSIDNTYKEAAKFKKNVFPVKLIFNKGKGFAIRAGLGFAKGDIIIIQDADLEYNPNDYKKLIQPIIDKKVKVVYGSRRLNTKNEKWSDFSFYLGGEVITFVTNLLYPTLNITDEPTCYKVLHCDVVDELELECKRFEFCPEVTAKIAKLGYRIQEVPIDYFPRSKKEGKHIKWKDGVQAIWVLLKWKFRRFPKC